MSCWPAPPSTRGRSPGGRKRRAGLALFDEGGDHTVDPTYLAPGGAPRRLLSLLGGPGPVVPRPPGQRALAHGEQARAPAAAHPLQPGQRRGAAGLPPPVPGRAVRDAALGGAGPGDHDRARLPDPGSPGGHPRRLGPGRPDRVDGVDQLRAGLAGYLAITGAELDHPYYLGLLGEAVAATTAGSGELAVVDEAIELVGTARPFYYLPEPTASVATSWPGTGGPPSRPPRPTWPGHGDRRRVRDPVGELRAAIRLCRLPDGSITRGGARHPACARMTSSDEGFGTPTYWWPGPCSTAQGLGGSDGLDASGAEVFDPSRTRCLAAIFSLGMISLPPPIR